MYSVEIQRISYYAEISSMMFAFGDSHEQNPETVRLVESITLNQLRLIVQEASKHAEGDHLNGKHLIFLLRKNKYKMQRFMKYLKNKENNKKAKAMEIGGSEEALPKHELVEFIEYIDETGELTNLAEYDEVKYERMVRADRISLALDEESYKKFYQARRTSFVSSKMSLTRNYENLALWIDPTKKFTFDTSALEVLSYYAYETVAQLTDYAMLVRLDHNRRTDPLNNLQGMHFSATMFNGEHRFGGQNPDYGSVFSGQPAISVGEIKEVMRRVYMPQAGKLNFGKTLPDHYHILAI